MHCLSAINVSVGKNALYTEDAINSRNLQRLYECHHAGQRYRIRHGYLKGGKKVAVVIKATSFIDKLISYFPSACALRRCFRNSLLRSAKNDYHTIVWGKNLLKINESIPFLSRSAWKKAMNPSEKYKLLGASVGRSYKKNPTLDKVYKQWENPDTYTANGNNVNNTRRLYGNPIVFSKNDKNRKNHIFSESYKRRWQELFFIGALTSSFTENCADSLFHAKIFNHTVPEKSSNRRLSISYDNILFHLKRSNN